MQIYWIIWNVQCEIECVELCECDYDVCQCLWFKGVMVLVDNQVIYWIEFYIFYIIGDFGIIVVMCWSGCDGSIIIIGYDVCLSKIVEYIIGLVFGSYGQVVLFQNDGKLIVLFCDLCFDNFVVINVVFLKIVGELGLFEFVEGFQCWQDDFKLVGKMYLLNWLDGCWFSFFQFLDSSFQLVWLGVVVLESDFVLVIGQDLLLFGLIMFIVFVFGMIVVICIVWCFGVLFIVFVQVSECIG